MPEILVEAGKFGPYAFLLVVFVGVIWKMSSQWLTVVDNNTKALTKLVGTSDRTCDELEKHDERAQKIERGVQHISETVDRIEGNQRVQLGQPVPSDRRV